MRKRRGRGGEEGEEDQVMSGVLTIGAASGGHLILLGDSNFHYNDASTWWRFLPWSPFSKWSVSDHVKEKSPSTMSAIGWRRVGCSEYEKMALVSVLDLVRKDTTVVIMCGQNDALDFTKWRAGRQLTCKEVKRFEAHVAKHYLELLALLERYRYVKIIKLCEPFDHSEAHMFHPSYLTLVEVLRSVVRTIVSMRSRCHLIQWVPADGAYLKDKMHLTGWGRVAFATHILDGLYC